MPVQTGSRLERLERLQRRTQHERQSAERRDDRLALPRLRDLEQQVNDALKAERQALFGNSVDQRLKEIGVTAKAIRTWAVERGLTKAQRGRLGAELVEAYIQHHQI